MNYFCFIKVNDWRIEITEYLNTIVGKRYYNVSAMNRIFKYSFSKEEDMLAFKLRFKEVC